jgi:25S rRNA (uracil2634-N3)-methyltransferase
VPLCLKGKKKVGAVRSTKNSKTTRASSRRAQGKEMLNSFQVASEEMEAVCKDSFLGGSQSKLYIPYDTWACIKNGCVCCAYKLLVTRPNLSISGRVFQPNQRPENCLRLRYDSRQGKNSTNYRKQQRAESEVCGDPGFGVYENNGQRLLTVGDGDLSFTLAMAKSLPRCSVTGTTYLSKREFYEVYEKANTMMIEAVEYKNMRLIHSVDGTELGRKKTPLCNEPYFHKVIWNFPCVAPTMSINTKDSARDGQNQEMEQNKVLLAKFFGTVHRVCTPGGEVHIVHKTKPPYSHWDVIAIAERSGLIYQCCVVFDKALCPGYKNRKARKGKGSFPCHDARVFVFTIPLIRAVETKRCMDKDGNSHSIYPTEIDDKSKFKRCTTEVLRRTMEIFCEDAKVKNPKKMKEQAKLAAKLKKQRRGSAKSPGGEVSISACAMKKKALALALNSGFHKWGKGHVGGSATNNGPGPRKRRSDSASKRGKGAQQRRDYHSSEHGTQAQPYKKQKHRAGY